MSSKKKDRPQEQPAEEKTTAAPAGEAKEAAPEQKAPETKPEPSAEEKLRAELAEEKDKYLRLAAEYDNFRRRSARERESLYSDVKADTLLKLLPVYDNLERALKQECSDEAYRKGVEMIMHQLTEELEKMGVTPIEAEGQSFDPALHNAVMHCEDPERGEGEIVAEFQKGFRLGERVIRFSMVQVAN